MALSSRRQIVVVAWSANTSIHRNSWAFPGVEGEEGLFLWLMV